MKVSRTAVAILLAVMSAAGCAAAGPPSDAGRPTTSGATASPGAAGYDPGNGFNPTDLAWLQLMRPMTEQDQRLLELVGTRTADDRLAALATRARGTNDASLTRLRQLLERANAPRTNPHEGHELPGLLTAGQLATIAETRGADFDRRFVDSFRAYAEQCARLAGAERQSGAEPGATGLAATIEQTATSQLAELKRLG